MFCYYKSFSWVFPQMLLLARPGSQIAIVSPWIEDIPLELPVIMFRNGEYTQPVTCLTDLFRHLIDCYEMEIHVYVREPLKFREMFMKSGSLPAEEAMKLIYTEYNHAKVFVTEKFCLTGSTNLIWTSLYRNPEVCTLESNTYGNAIRWVRRNLNL